MKNSRLATQVSFTIIAITLVGMFFGLSMNKRPSEMPKEPIVQKEVATELGVRKALENNPSDISELITALGTKGSSLPSSISEKLKKAELSLSVASIKDFEKSLSTIVEIAHYDNIIVDGNRFKLRDEFYKELEDNASFQSSPHFKNVKRADRRGLMLFARVVKDFVESPDFKEKEQAILKTASIQRKTKLLYQYSLLDKVYGLESIVAVQKSLADEVCKATGLDVDSLVTLAWSALYDPSFFYKNGNKDKVYWTMKEASNKNKELATLWLVLTGKN